MMEQPMHKKTDEKRSRMFSSSWKATFAGAGLFIASGYALPQTAPDLHPREHQSFAKEGIATQTLDELRARVVGRALSQFKALMASI
jgi:hypothetical protein